MNPEVTHCGSTPFHFTALMQLKKGTSANNIRYFWIQNYGSTLFWSLSVQLFCPIPSEFPLFLKLTILFFHPYFVGKWNFRDSFVHSLRSWTKISHSSFIFQLNKGGKTRFQARKREIHRECDKIIEQMTIFSKYSF